MEMETGRSRRPAHGVRAGSPVGGGGTAVGEGLPTCYQRGNDDRRPRARDGHVGGTTSGPAGGGGVAAEEGLAHLVRMPTLLVSAYTRPGLHNEEGSCTILIRYDGIGMRSCMLQISFNLCWNGFFPGMKCCISIFVSHTPWRCNNILLDVVHHSFPVWNVASRDLFPSDPICCNTIDPYCATFFSLIDVLLGKNLVRTLQPFQRLHSKCCTKLFQPVI